MLPGKGRVPGCFIRGRDDRTGFVVQMQTSSSAATRRGLKPLY
jgi:hypothetical protein